MGRLHKGLKIYTKKNVNMSLNELVEQEKIGGEQANIDDIGSKKNEEDNENTIKTQ